MADFELLAPGGHQELVDEVLDRLDTKADYDGYYAQLTAGAADSLTGRGDGVSASYLYRTTGGDADVADGTATVKSIHGRTVVWNQLNSDTDNTNTTGLTATKNGDGSRTLNGTATSNGVIYFVGDIKPVANHKYLVRGCPAGGSASTYYLSMNGQNADYGTGGIITVTNPISPSRFLMWIASGQTFDNVTIWPQLFDLTKMFGAGNEPATVAEFEALYPLPYYAYDAGSLLSVQMDGIETVGFNQWDEEWERGSYNDSTGAPVADTGMIRVKNPIEVFPSTEYYFKAPSNGVLFFYDEADSFIRNDTSANANKVFTTPANCRYMRFRMASNYGTTYKHDICISLSWSGYRNGEYEPYWSAQRLIDVATYFPNGMRSAGTVYDELTSDAAIVRVGAVDLGTLTWTYSNAHRYYSDGIASSILLQANSSAIPYATAEKYRIAPATTSLDTNTDALVVMFDGSPGRLVTYAESADAPKPSGLLFYAVKTPTTTPIDPPLNLTYRVSDFGTERVTHTASSAAPTMQVVYGLNVVDTVRRLPTEYISHDSFTQFRIALATFLDATITESWDATDGRYEYTITASESEG